MYYRNPSTTVRSSPIKSRHASMAHQHRYPGSSKKIPETSRVSSFSSPAAPRHSTKERSSLGSSRPHPLPTGLTLSPSHHCPGHHSQFLGRAIPFRRMGHRSINPARQPQDARQRGHGPARRGQGHRQRNIAITDTSKSILGWMGQAFGRARRCQTALRMLICPARGAPSDRQPAGPPRRRRRGVRAWR